jgi:hypothetical protein
VALPQLGDLPQQEPRNLLSLGAELEFNVHYCKYTDGMSGESESRGS